ncbi:MAG TPA: hypothetical protein VKC66_30720 [Xanthobacteraceae bacterium]|nr:hypothetical protein [Xanthobacteraceae bacterium]
MMAKAARNMASAIATPVPNLDAVAEISNIPTIVRNSLAVDSPAWQSSQAKIAVGRV